MNINEAAEYDSRMTKDLQIQLFISPKLFMII